MGIHVIAHAEDVQPRAHLGVGATCPLGDLRLVGDARRRQPVGEEDDETGDTGTRLAARQNLQPGPQGPVDIGATPRLKPPGEAPCLRQRVPVHRAQRGGKDTEFVVEGHNGEAILGPQLPQDKLQRIPRLHHLLALHAAGAIDDEDNIFGQGRILPLGLLGREEKEEVFSLRQRSRQQSRTEACLGRREEEDEILPRLNLLCRPGHARPALSEPLGQHIVVWGVDAAQPPQRVYLDTYGNLLQGEGRVLLGAEDVVIAPHRPGGAQRLCVLQHHRLHVPGGQLQVRYQGLPIGVAQ